MSGLHETGRITSDDVSKELQQRLVDLASAINSIVTNSTDKFTFDIITKMISISTSMGFSDVSIKGNTLTNIIKNGNFANGNANIATFAATISISNKLFRLTGDGTNPTVYMLSPITPGDKSLGKYFVKVRMRVTNADCTMMFVYGKGGKFVKQILTPVQNQWYDVYAIIEATNTNPTYNIYVDHRYADAATANGKVMEIEGDFTKGGGVFAIPLTGTPYENYTADQINAMIASYFEGLKSTQKVDVISHGKNLANSKNGDLTNWKFVNTTSNTVENGYFKSTNQTGGSINGVLPINNLIKGKTYTITVTAYVPAVATDVRKVTLGIFEANFSKLIDWVNLDFRDCITPTTRSIQFTPTNNFSVAGLYIIAQNGPIFIKNIMLNEGTTALPYEPYQESKIAVNCTDITKFTLSELMNGKQNEINVVKGYPSAVKRVERKILTSANILALVTSLSNIDYITFSSTALTGIVPQTSVSSGQVLVGGYTEFKGTSANWDLAENSYKYAYSSALSSNGILFLPKGTYANLAAAQTALAGLEIYYELATPIFIPYEDFKDYGIQLEGELSNFNGYTNFALSPSDITPDVEITYNKSITSAIESLTGSVVSAQKEITELKSELNITNTSINNLTGRVDLNMPTAVLPQVIDLNVYSALKTVTKEVPSEIPNIAKFEFYGMDYCNLLGRLGSMRDVFSTNLNLAYGLNLIDANTPVFTKDVDGNYQTFTPTAAYGRLSSYRNMGSTIELTPPIEAGKTYFVCSEIKTTDNTATVSMENATWVAGFTHTGDNKWQKICGIYTPNAGAIDSAAILGITTKTSGWVPISVRKSFMIDITNGGKFANFLSMAGVNLTDYNAIFNWMRSNVEYGESLVRVVNPMISIADSEDNDFYRCGCLLEGELFANESVHVIGDNVVMLSKYYNEMILSGNAVAWKYLDKPTSGFKRFYFPLHPEIGVTDLDAIVFTKSNGKIITKGNTTTAADLWEYDSTNKRFILSISDNYTGFGDTYAPSDNEVAAFFLGWRMYDNVNPETGKYSTGTKAWTEYTACGRPGSNGLNTNTLPTTQANLITDRHCPCFYKIKYAFSKGSSGAFVNENLLKVRNFKPVIFDSKILTRSIKYTTGTVYDEQVSLAYIGANPYINLVSPTVSVPCKNPVGKILEISRNGKRETSAWSKIYNAGSYGEYLAYGESNILIDNGALYSMDYKISNIVAPLVGRATIRAYPELSTNLSLFMNNFLQKQKESFDMIDHIEGRTIMRLNTSKVVYFDKRITPSCKAIVEPLIKTNGSITYETTYGALIISSNAVESTDVPIQWYIELF